MPVSRNDEAVFQRAILTRSSHCGFADSAQWAGVLDQEGKGKEEYDGTQFKFHGKSVYELEQGKSTAFKKNIENG